MTDAHGRIAKAIERRQRDSERKRGAAWHSYTEMINARQPLSVVGVAERAGVSRDLIYDMPDLLSAIQARRGTPQNSSRAPAAVDPSLKVKLHHATKEMTRLTSQLAQTEKALARALGVAAAPPINGDEPASLHGEIARLGADLIAERNARNRLRLEHDELQEEHRAARESNRVYLKELDELRRQLDRAERALARRDIRPAT